MSFKGTKTTNSGINNIYLPSGFDHPITIIIQGDDKNIIKIIPQKKESVQKTNEEETKFKSKTSKYQKEPKTSFNNMKYKSSDESKSSDETKSYVAQSSDESKSSVAQSSDESKSFVAQIPTNHRPELNPEQIKAGAERYRDFIVSFCESKTKDINISTQVINISGTLLKYNAKNKYFWHYGPTTDGYHFHRSLKIYEDNNITLGFKQAQQILKEKGFKLIDVSNPDKGTRLVILLTSIDNKVQDENSTLWHNLNTIV